MARKLILITLFFIALFTACKKDATVAPQLGRDNNAFNIYEEHFLDLLWKINPDMATLAGYHKYDSLLVVPNAKSRDVMLTFINLQSDSLARFEAKDLSDINQIDYHILQNQLEYTIWKNTILKAYEWDPSAYNVIPAFAYILDGHYAPLTKRLRNFYEKMDNVPDYYKAAQKQIKNPVPELADLAMEQNLGGIDVFEKIFIDSLKKSDIPAAEQKKMTGRMLTSVEAIKGYAAWLKNLKNDHPRSFRLGKQLYEDKFKYEIQSAFNTQQMYNAAADRKKTLHREMAKLSRELWPKYFGNKTMPADSLEMISRVIDTLSGEHSTVAGFQPDIVKQIAKLTAFVKSKDLITIDPTKHLRIRTEPGYMAGTYIASVSAPGQYDDEQSTYLNVANLATLPAQTAQSYLREYNQHTLQLLSMHETVPGYYLQSIYANKAPGIIKTIFPNIALIKGWAVYSDQMMMDNDFDTSPEMKLMADKWYLRTVCDMLLDYSVHCNGLTKEQAIKLLMHEAFEQQAEADAKWKQVTISSVRLAGSFTGFKEIMDLREAYKVKAADKYKLREFNEKLLGYGNAPIKFIKDAIMNK